jgi:N,N'-diacetyllegionaminate synthase
VPRTLIIAEAGVNHNGSMDLAFKLIDAAKTAGADMVKFQTFKASDLVSESAKKAAYQQAVTDAGETQFEMIKKLELSREDHLELMRYCDEVGIEFLSAPFDLTSIDLLHELGVKRFKIPSGEITNYPYLKAMARYNKPVIMSTGMADMEEIQAALEVLTSHGTEEQNISVLHCNTEYPTPFEDVNLKAIKTMSQTLELPIGYSDHTRGIEVPIAAVALGAVIIEKHFTLDRTLPGPDHKASLEPSELAKMVITIRNIEEALGDGIKRPSTSEKKNITVVRKSIVASKDIRSGERFTLENITTKRPGDGISPMKIEEILKLSASKEYKKDDSIKLD